MALGNEAVLEGALMLERMEDEMRGIKAGEIWVIDFGMAAKVRPALLLTGEPAPKELDVVTV